jgi:hypothetical protein
MSKIEPNPESKDNAFIKDKEIAIGEDPPNSRRTDAR